MLSIFFFFYFNFRNAGFCDFFIRVCGRKASGGRMALSVVLKVDIEIELLSVCVCGFCLF